MKISEYAVKNYQFTLIMFLIAVALGITTLLNMPRSEDPEIEAPQYAIVVYKSQRHGGTGSRPGGRKDP
jgi:multidrug efflux pump subunit AcrB